MEKNRRPMKSLSKLHHLNCGSFNFNMRAFNTSAIKTTEIAASNAANELILDKSYHVQSINCFYDTHFVLSNGQHTWAGILKYDFQGKCFYAIYIIQYAIFIRTQHLILQLNCWLFSGHNPFLMNLNQLSSECFKISLLKKCLIKGFSMEIQTCVGVRISL